MSQSQGNLSVEWFEQVTIITPLPSMLYKFDLDDEFNQAAENEVPALILFDMSKMVYVGSTFLGKLIGAASVARKRAGHAALCNLHPNVADVMRITRLDSFFDVYSTRDSAIALMQSARSNSQESPKER